MCPGTAEQGAVGMHDPLQSALGGLERRLHAQHRRTFLRQMSLALNGISEDLGQGALFYYTADSSERHSSESRDSFQQTSVLSYFPHRWPGAQCPPLKGEEVCFGSGYSPGYSPG